MCMIILVNRISKVVMMIMAIMIFMLSLMLTVMAMLVIVLRIMMIFEYNVAIGSLAGVGWASGWGPNEPRCHYK